MTRATPFALPLRRPLRIAGVAVPARFGTLIACGAGVGEASARPGAAPPDVADATALRAAIACAALDDRARAAGVPLAALLGDVRRRSVPLNALLTAGDPEAVAGEAAGWVRRGFRCLKLKLAPGDIEADRRRLVAVRAAVGPDIALRADANAAWSVAEAIAALRRLGDLDLEYVEQPVADLAGLATVRRAVPMPIAADESVIDLASVDQIIAARAADVLVLKPAWMGLRESIAAADRAHAAGLGVSVTSTLDSSVGIAAAAQVAAAIRGPLRACGLATAALLAGDLVRQPLRVADGVLHLPDRPGLGVDVDDDALARHQIAAAYAIAAAPDDARPMAVAGAATHGTGSLLGERAARHGDRVALSDGARTLTFAALDRRAAAVAARLERAGIARGDHVALLVADRMAFAVWLHGIAHRGAVAVLLGERATAAELERQLRTRPCRAIVTDAPDRASGLAAALLDATDIGEGTAAAVPFDADAPHTVVFTSGSTGAPKAITLSAGNHYWSAVGSALALGVRDDDRWLACLPLHHVGGLAILMRGLVSAIPVRLQARFDPASVNAAIDGDGISRVSLVPTMLQRVLVARDARPFPATLRTVLLGGAPAPRALLADCARRGVPVVTTYGMTETASQIAVDGRPLLGVAVRVRRDGADAPRGAVGIIEVGGPIVSAAQRGEDGWLVTRDLGTLDAAGRLAVVGRADDVIISGGENVHPREVEQALESHPGVAEACVFGLPDPEWGETVAAWVRPLALPGPDPAALLAHARQQLAPYKLPRRVSIVGDFPRSAAGKILRHAVRAAALPAAAGAPARA